MGPEGGDLMPRKEVLVYCPDLFGIINQAELKADRELLDAAPHMKIVANVALGADNLDVQLMAERSVWATNTPTTFVEDTAEMTLGLIIGLARRIREADAFVRTGKWERFQPGIWDETRLKGKTLGIVGFGRIGKAVAKRARAFVMRILFHRRTKVDHIEYRSWDKLLAEADFISLHIPLNDFSQRLINKECLGLMKKGAYLINILRGRVVNEQALVDALNSGHLAGAALDVFEEEPRVHGELLKMHNVILPPHIGGGSRESRFQARYLCAQNVAAVIQGKRPPASFNKVKAKYSLRGIWGSGFPHWDGCSGGLRPHSGRGGDPGQGVAAFCEAHLTPLSHKKRRKGGIK